MIYTRRSYCVYDTTNITQEIKGTRDRPRLELMMYMFHSKLVMYLNFLCAECTCVKQRYGYMV